MKGSHSSKDKHYRVYTLNLIPMLPKEEDDDLCSMDDLLSPISKTDPKTEKQKLKTHVELIQNKLDIVAETDGNKAVKATKNIQPGKKNTNAKVSTPTADPKPPTPSDVLIQKSMQHKFQTLRTALKKVMDGDAGRISPLPSGIPAPRRADQIPLHKGSCVFIDKETLRRIFVGKPGMYTLRLCESLLDRETFIRLAFAHTEDKFIRLAGTQLLAITTHVLEVFKAQGKSITRDTILGFIVQKLQTLQSTVLQGHKGAPLDDYAALEKLIEEEGFSFSP